MKRLVSSLSLILLLTGCAGTGDPRSSATELEPGRRYDVLSAGQRHFTFTLAEPANVVLESQTLPGEGGMVSPAGQLLDADGQVVARDWNSGEYSNFRIERRLEAGTWYLRVTTPHASPASFGSMEQDHRYSVLLRVDRNT